MIYARQEDAFWKFQGAFFPSFHSRDIPTGLFYGKGGVRDGTFPLNGQKASLKSTKRGVKDSCVLRNGRES